jgi:uroporphyrin-3 C-methyltransferase
MSDPSDEPQDKTADAEFPDVDDSIRIEEPRRARAPVRIAILAIMLSIASLAGLGYVVLRPAPTQEVQKPDTAAVDALASRVQSGEESILRLEQRLNGLSNRNDAQADSMDTFQQQLDLRLKRQMEVFESLPGRMSNVENSMSSIQGISTGVRDSWLTAEAEYYMQIANAQLQLAGNPHLARLALLQADDRIRQLANPALTNVRRALADELQALEFISRPDIEGVTLTLASLANSVDSLPLQQDIELPTDDSPAIQDELSGVDRAMASLKSTLGDVVSVRRTDEAVRPLIAPEAAYFLRVNLSLQLQIARLALLRGERAAFQQSLDDTDKWLGDYYDTNSAKVKAARQTIAEVRDSLFDIEMPDISESLRLLRQFNSLSSNTEDNAAPIGFESTQ